MDNRTGLNLAHRYLDAGWHPLPLPAGEKHPPPEGTTGYGGIDLTASEIDSYAWDGNIGVRMPIDVIGIDVDVYKGGAATRDELVDRLCPLPNTYVSHSSRRDGSGIEFYRVPVGMTWITGLPGIEIVQRTHRYAVVWPSMHPEGRPYHWLDQAEPDVPQGVPQVEDLAELPWAWIEELSRASDEAGDVTRAVDGKDRADFLSRYTQADAPGYLTGTVVGHFHEKRRAGFSRHDSMQHCLTWAMECVRAGLVSGEQAVRELGAAWQEAMWNEPRRAALNGVAPTEFEAMLRHAIGKVKDRPDDAFHHLHDEIAGIPMLSGRPVLLPPDPVIVDYQSSGVFLDWHAFANRDAAAQLWLVEGLWPWGRALALWAAAKQGKSELALWCACKLALGEHPWTGDPTEPVDVAYLDFEMTPDDLDDRLVDFDIDPLRLTRLHYTQHPPIHALDTEQGGQELEELVREVGAQAVIIDTFGRAVRGDENEADTVRDFARYTGSRLKALGVGYLRTDHAGKDMSKGQRGSSAKRDDVDIVWSQRRIDKGVLLDCEGSSRLGWVTPKLKLDRVVTNDVVSYRTPVVLGTPAGVKAKADELDKAGIPLDAGRPAVIAALKDAGLKAGKSTVLSEAIKYRQEEARRLARMGQKPVDNSVENEGTARGNSSPPEGGDSGREQEWEQVDEPF